MVFSRGIFALAGLACLLIILFQASVTRLIPLYAIGVFLSFTLSQAGMARRWWKAGHLKPGEEVVEPGSVVVHDHQWKSKMIINGFGSACTFIVMLVFAATKFSDGAWIIILLIPSLIAIFFAIHLHYTHLAKKLTLENYQGPETVGRHRVILLIASVHRGSLTALRYASMLSYDVTALHVSVDSDEARRVSEKWGIYGQGTRLVILDSPYRLMIEPIMAYIQNILAIRQPNETVTIVVPQFVPRRWWENLLHNQTALLLRFGLLFKPGVVIVEVPYQV